MSGSWRDLPGWWPMDPELLDQLSRPFYGQRDLRPLDPALLPPAGPDTGRPVRELDTTRRPLGGSW